MPRENAAVKLDLRSVELRRTIVNMLAVSRRGHLASALSILEVMRVLYDDILHFDPQKPRWEGRDRFVLSKGHSCLALYAILADKKFFPTEELWKFCKPEGILGGHPDYGKIPGVEASTGSLGHGLSIALGFALDAKYQRAPHRVFVLIGDGETNEGSIWEAALCASKYQLSNLTVLIDYNKQQSYGSTAEVLNLEPFVAKWLSFGFATTEVDGHDVDALRDTLLQVPLQPDKPTAVICHTIKGKGIDFVEEDPGWHHKAKISDEEIHALLAALDRQT